MNRRHFSQIILSTVLVFTFSAPVIAQERGTLDEAKALGKRRFNPNLCFQ
jgi:hypothetical protein